MEPHQLSRADARRIAVRAQLLAAARPTDMLDVVRHLSAIQQDFTKHVALNVDLVLWSRLGAAYQRRELALAIERREIVEYRGFLRPAEDLALYRVEMADRASTGAQDGWRESVRRWVASNDRGRRAVLDHLEDGGPSTAREIPDACDVPWQSTGWSNDKNVMRMLEFMEVRGEVAVAGRLGRERMWDLADRVFPPTPTPALPVAEAIQVRNQRRLHSLGIARVRATEMPIEPNDVGGVGEAAVVDGVKGEWRVDPAYLDAHFAGRTAIISPLDRLVFDRARMADLFEFDYQLEMYKPAAKRRWGYFALPILHGDRLVGKVDAEAKPKAHVLLVHAIHEDEKFTTAMRTGVDAEIESLATLLDLDVDAA